MKSKEEIQEGLHEFIEEIKSADDLSKLETRFLIETAIKSATLGALIDIRDTLNAQNKIGGD